MSKKITIDADLSKVIKEFRKTFQEVQRMAPKKMTMGFNFEEIKKWKMANVDAFRSATKGLEEAQNKMKEILSIQKEMAEQGKEVGADLSEGFKKAAESAKKYGKEIRDIQKASSSANFLQRLGVQFRTQAQTSGGMKGGVEDTVGKAIGGLGDAAGMLGGPWGKLAGMGVGAYMGARALAAPRRGLAGTNLELAGLSNRRLSDEDLKTMRRSGVEQGFTAEETMGAAVGLQRGAGEVNSRALQKFSGLRRATGLSAEEMTGFAGTLRGAATDKGGTDLAQNLDKVGKMYSQAMASALDKSGALRFLQTTAEMTDQIANEGSADVDAIKNTLSSLSMQSDFYKANAGRGAAALRGGESFFKSEQGTGLALRAMQNAPGNILAGKGPMEALFQQQLGFTQKGGMGAEGLKAITKEVVRAASGLTPENFGKASGEQKAGGFLAVQKAFGISASNAQKLVESQLSGKEISAKEIEEMMKDPADRTNDLLDKQIKQNEASFNEVIMTLGDKIANPMAKMEGYVAEIAKVITGSSAESINFNRASKALTSRGDLSSDDTANLLQHVQNHPGGMKGQLAGAENMFIDLGTNIDKRQKSNVAAGLDRNAGLSEENALIRQLGDMIRNLKKDIDSKPDKTYLSPARKY